MMKKASLAKEFIIFVSIVVGSVILLSGSYAWRTYQGQSDRIVEQLQSSGMRVERSLTQSFKYSTYLLEYILSQINGKWDDLPYIDNLLHTLRVDQDNNAAFSWNMFSWSDQYHHVRVNSLYRILPKPVDISAMNNMAATMTEPGVMQLGKPTYGAVSGQLVIPASIGTVDEFGRYVGAIGIGFNVDGIVAKLERIVDNSNIRYALIDTRNYQAVVRSPYENTSQMPAIITPLKQQVNGTVPAGMLSYYSPFSTESAYTYYQKIPDTPYVLLLSFNADIARTAMWKQVSNQLVRFIIGGSVVILLLTLLYRRLINPVMQLSIVADQISRDEKDITIPVSGHYEIINLAEKLQQVVNYVQEIKQVRNQLHEQSIALRTAKEDIEKAHAEVQQLNATLEQRVQERTKSLQEALASRQEFMNHLGHEVRTPVSSIKTRVELLMMDWDSFTTQEQKEYLADIETNTIRLCNLVTNLLDLFKSGAGKMTYTMQRHNLADIAAEIIEECRPLYLQKALQLVLDNRAEHSNTQCDKMRIGQVLRNLLTNACRYTGKGEVRLILYNTEMHSEDGRTLPAIAIAVKDQGIGIPESELGKVFESFVQSSRTNNKAGGTGLGLAICREIVTAHHGQIWAENNKGVDGSTFTVLLLAEQKEVQARQLIEV